MIRGVRYGGEKKTNRVGNFESAAFMDKMCILCLRGCKVMDEMHILPFMDA
jgi:hypothetical protein